LVLFIVFITTIAILSHAPALADRNVAGAESAAATRPGQIVEDTDEGWTWTGMAAVSGAQFHGGSVHAGGPGTSGVYVFTGVGVVLYSLHADGIRVNNHTNPLGKLSIAIDGKPKDTVDLSAAQETPDAKVFSVSSLSEGTHVLEVKAVGGWGVVDRIAVLSPEDVGDGGRDYYIIPHNATDKALSAENGDFSDNTAVNIWAATGSQSQIWHVAPLGDGKFRISPKSSPNQALTLLNRKTPPSMGDPCTMCGVYAYSGSAAQQWKVTPLANGYCEIASTFDGSSLNVIGGGTNNGTLVISYAWQAGSVNEEWFFKPAGK
jgi:hypothetical protein